MTSPIPFDQWGEDALLWGGTVGTDSGSVSAVGTWVSGWVGKGTGTAPTSILATSQELQSDEQEESFLQEAEEVGKDIAVRLAEDEAISFIKMALRAIE